MRERGARALTAVAATAAVAVAVLAPAAPAAFPGANGRVCFTSSFEDRRGEIYSVEADGTGLRRLTTDPKEDAQCAWSPDGRRIAFRRLEPDGYQEVFTMNADGSGERRLTFSAPRGIDSQPAWSPDGRRLLFRSNRAHPDTREGDIWVMDADGSDPELLIGLRGDERYPSFSPDGKRIAFRSDRDGDGEIYTARADGTGLRQLTFNARRPGEGSFAGLDTAPAWAPDSRRITFESFRHDQRAADPTARERELRAELYVIGADGRGERRLTDNAFHDEGQATSPDGAQVAFTSARSAPGGGTGSDLYLMAPDGSGQRLLFAASGREESPDWGPVPGTTPPPPMLAPPDRDRDGIPDAREDRNRNGRRDRGESDARRRDTDRDGLADGREDRNRNGRRDRGETDATRRDTDGDGLADSRDRHPLDRRRR